MDNILFVPAIRELEWVQDILPGTSPAELSVGGRRVIEYALEDDNKIIFRPSGTEPKIKAYLFAKGATRADAEAIEAKLRAAAEEIFA